MCLGILLLSQSASAAQCNATSSEAPAGWAISVDSNQFGFTYELIVATSGIYLTMQQGERAKIYWNYTLAWAKDYGQYAYAMALSADQSFLIAGSIFLGQVSIGKLNCSDGSVIATQSTPYNDYYHYIYSRDERALCIADPYGWFQLVNTTSFTLISSGVIQLHPIATGAFLNDSHVFLTTTTSRILLIDNAMTIFWQRQQQGLSSLLQISVIDNKLFWLASNGSEVRFGALTTSSGVQIFRSIVFVSYTDNYHLYLKILTMGDKIFFLNTGNLKQYGWMIGINRSNYSVTDRLQLDAGANKMAFYKCSVQAFNGQMYFHLYTGGANTAILTTLNGINSTSLITVNYSNLWNDGVLKS